MADHENLDSLDNSESEKNEAVSFFKNVYRLYYISIVIGLFPFISLVLFIVDLYTIKATDNVFWVVFLLGLIPCGLLAGVLILIGLIKAIRKKNHPNIAIGILGLICSLVIVVGGVVGFLLIYVVTS